MRLKASTDYALRMVFYLATCDGACSSKQIAEDLDIPRDYLIQLAQFLRNAKIVKAYAGKNGGYALAKPTGDISLLDVFEAVESPSKTPEKKARAKQGPTKTINEASAYSLAMYREFLGRATVEQVLAAVDNDIDVAEAVTACLGSAEGNTD